MRLINIEVKSLPGTILALGITPPTTYDVLKTLLSVALRSTTLIGPVVDGCEPLNR